MTARPQPRFEILAGMPAEAPYPEQFSETGEGNHKEGFVVRIRPPDGADWVGNFQRGLSESDSVHIHPNARDLIVVAGGAAYVVQTASRRLIETFGGQICWSQAIPEHRLLLFHDGLGFHAYGEAGCLWRTRRLSWDGIRVDSIAYPRLVGTAWTYNGDRWISFELDLETGEVIGGSCSE